MMQTRRRFLEGALGSTAIGLNVSLSAHAQAWPERPVRVIVAFAPGGNSDSIARIICQRLGKAFGQSFFIENRGGNGGALGGEAAAHAAPDGYTLFMAVSSPMAVTPAIWKVRYDPIKDFTAISNVGSNPLVLTVNHELPVKSVADFVAYARARPGKLTFGSGGVGTINHLSMTLFAKRAGLDLIHVPYKGGGPAMIDLISGQINSMFANVSDALKQADSGKVRMLAVSSLQRIPEAPDVPTVSESGYAGFNTVTWNGLVAPAGTPKQIVDRIAAEVARAARDPEIIEQLSNIGVTAVGDTPEEFAATIREDVALWAEVVKIAGLQGTGQ
jgi:tripartite-type tricarboxylate transporter receptor subunit TctC